MHKTQLWFKSEVERWRAIAAFIWIFFMIPVFIAFFVFIGNIDLSSPHTWVSDSVTSLLSIGSIAHLFTANAFMCTLAVWNSYFYTVLPSISKNKPAQIFRLFNRSNCIIILYYFIASAIISYSYVSIIGGRYSHLADQCSDTSDEKKCLNEQHIFLILNGCFMGVFCGINFILYHNKLQFPIIQQEKFFNIKFQMNDILCKGLFFILRYLKFYYVLYYILIGRMVKSFVSSNLGLQTSNVAVDSFTGLLDFRLFWQATTIGLMLSICTALMNLIYISYQTENYQFPIQVCHDDENFPSLNAALDCSSHPLLQHLAFQDLYYLSKYDKSRRKEIYSLTQPGGHPILWNTTCSQCFSLIKNLIGVFQIYNDQILLTGTMKQINSNNDKQKTSKFWNNNSKKSDKSDIPSLIEINKILAEPQIFVWVIEGLSYLVAHSYTEDIFGVVQKSIPEYISTLLLLQDVIEKHQKLSPFLISNNEKNPNSQNYSETNYSLFITVVKNSIYRFVAAFEKHYEDLPLEVEIFRKLEPYREYRE